MASWALRLLKVFSSDGELARFEVLRRIARHIVPRYRFKWPQMAWWDDVAFNRYLDRFGERDGLNTDRRWMAYQLMRLVDAVPGDTAECGVYEGSTSYLMCRFARPDVGQKRTHFVFDSFEGLSAPSAADGEAWSRGDLSCGLDVVRAHLASFDNVSFHKGWIPGRFTDVEDRRFSFVHIDVDLYEPTLDSIRFFYSRMNDGGIVLCDDYGFTTCPGATRALDEFLSDKPEQMISLCCGGGFLIKGQRTGRRIEP